MRPGLRKFALTLHVTCSVGWLGGVACSIALAVAGVASHDGVTVRAVYVTMQLIGWYALIPLSVASLLTGLVQALGTSWGVFRHYWVLIKLVMNLSATAVLLLYMQTLGKLADRAAAMPASADLGRLRDPSPVLHATAALILVAIAATLSVYKPRGMTRYGWRKQQERRT